MKNLADHILNTHATFENRCNENKNKINIGLSVAKEKCDHLSKETSTIGDLQQTRNEDHSAYEAQTEELLKRGGIGSATG